MFVYLLLGLVVFLITATITFKTGGFDWAKPLSLAEDFAHERKISIETFVGVASIIVFLVWVVMIPSIVIYFMERK